MPYVFQETQLGEARPASEFPSLPSEVYEETFAQAFEENPVVAMARGAELVSDYSSSGKKLDFMAASRKLKERGMEGDIKVSGGGITEDALNTLMFRKGIEKRRQEVFGQAEGGYGQGAARLGISLATGLVDPLNVAMAFIPVVGEARYTSMLAKAGSALGRAGVRAGVGAVEGIAGAALIEPIIAGSRRYEQADYDMADSLLNVAFGGVFGAGLHSVGGAISDGVTHYRGAEPAWRGMENVPHQEILLVQNLRQEIARGMDARDVARVTETWSPEARRAVAVDTRAVTPAEAAHQALPPQVRENALKQAIVQAVSDEPVNVQPMIQTAASRQAPVSRFDASLPSSEYLAIPDAPPKAIMDQFSRVESVPLESARRTQSRMGGESPGALIDGYADRPVAVRLENGEHLVFDGHHRAIAAAQRGDKAMDMYVVDAKRYAPELAGRKRTETRESDDDLLRALGIEPGRASGSSLLDSGGDAAKSIAYAEKILARETDTGTPTADALKNATDEADLAQSDLKALAERLGEDAEDAELTEILAAAANSERWARAAELATVCLVRGG